MTSVKHLHLILIRYWSPLIKTLSLVKHSWPVWRVNQWGWEDAVCWKTWGKKPKHTLQAQVCQIKMLRGFEVHVLHVWLYVLHNINKLSSLLYAFLLSSVIRKNTWLYGIMASFSSSRIIISHTYAKIGHIYIQLVIHINSFIEWICFSKLGPVWKSNCFWNNNSVALEVIWARSI